MATFSYAYLAAKDDSGNWYATGPDVTGGADDTITDNISNGSGDQPGVLGDVVPDTFSYSVGAISGTANYFGLAFNAGNQSSGFIAKADNGRFYYVTNVAPTNFVHGQAYLTVEVGQECLLCFMRGTMIRTPEGESPVEALKCGDLVMTTDGRAVPVRWIGRQTVSSIFGDPLRFRPTRIKAGALGEGVPARDLLLSPDHAILLEGVLVQAGALVNGTSIVREKDVPEIFTYYHVEVDDHSLILAEGTPAETFIDNVDRANFDNWNEYRALYPDGKAVVEMAYPRAKAYRQVPRAIRERLTERGVTLYGERMASVA